MTQTAAQAAGLEAGRAKSQARTVDGAEHWAFLTIVLGYSVHDARREMAGNSKSGYLPDNRLKRYRDYLAAHPEVEAELRELYG